MALRVTGDRGDHGAAATHVETALVEAFAAEWGRVVSVLIRMTGDWSLAEECAQEAFVAAARRWPLDGVPDRPGAWLVTTARNRALDRLRRASTERRVLADLHREATVTHAPGPLGSAPPHRPDHADHADDDVPDDRLRLVFTCCHPAIALESRVALALRTLCGLEVAEIARAFGVGEAAMAKRLVRTRAKIQRAGIPYRVPPAHLLPERLTSVLGVIYLLFTEGYAATSGGLLRTDLSAEAVRLARVLADLMPDEPEALGLLALVLLHDARRPARTDADGRLVPLEEQDRTRWDADGIAAGRDVLRRAERLADLRPGPYLLQARIAELHAVAPVAGATDWGAIARCYAELSALTPSPWVALSRAVAVGMADGPEAGLALVAEVADGGALARSHLVAATRADLLRRAGRPTEAADAYRAALALVTNDAERRFLVRRLAEVEREHTRPQPGREHTRPQPGREHTQP